MRFDKWLQITVPDKKQSIQGNGTIKLINPPDLDYDNSSVVDPDPYSVSTHVNLG